MINQSKEQKGLYWRANCKPHKLHKKVLTNQIKNHQNQLHCFGYKICTCLWFNIKKFNRIFFTRNKKYRKLKAKARDSQKFEK